MPICRLQKTASGYPLAEVFVAGFRMDVAVRKMLDRVAISMAVICGIHCLVTPVLLVVLPLLATTFWVDENFHLWMLLLVVPTTTLAVWSGCRRHKDKWVVSFAAFGLAILVSALIAERLGHTETQKEFQSLEPSAGTDSVAHLAGGGCCVLHPAQADPSENENGALRKTDWVSWHALLNTLGGCFLVAGHTRNFLLCRKDNCSHEETCGSR